MKLVVAQFAHSSMTLDQTIQAALDRQEVIDALFDRSYALLSDEGRFLYHLLASIGKPCPEVILHRLMTRRSLNFFDARGDVSKALARHLPKVPRIRFGADPPGSCTTSRYAGASWASGRVTSL